MIDHETRTMNVTTKAEIRTLLAVSVQKLVVLLLHFQVGVMNWYMPSN
jgi:hypothetical protein